MSEIDIGAAEWYLDPREVDKKVEDMTNLVNETVEQYPHLPGLGNKLNEKLYESTTALRLTAQEETQKLVEDRVSGKLQEVAMQYGLQGRFQDVYMGMVDVIAPFATALGGPNATRDLLTKNFDAYFKNHYGASSQFPNQGKIDILNEAITNKDMQSIISPETMGGAIKVHKQMIEALKTTNKSEFETRKNNIKDLEDSGVKIDPEKKTRYMLTGDYSDIDPAKISEVEKRKDAIKAAQAAGYPMNVDIIGPYILTGNIPDNVDKDVDARKAQIDTRNAERVAKGIPKYSQRIYDTYILTGNMLEDTELEKVKANIKYMRDVLEIEISPDQEAGMISNHYKISPLQEGKNVRTKLKGGLEREPTEIEVARALNVDEGRPLVELHDKGESEYQKEVGGGIGKQVIGAMEKKGLAFENLDRLAGMRDVLGQKDFTPGAFARPRLALSRMATWVNSIAPNPLMDEIIEKVGKASTAEAFDRISKEMLLLMAKYVGRITNLSLTFARDTVPGLLKTLEGNLLIIAFMERDAQRDIDLGKIAEDYRKGLSPEGKPDYFQALNAYYENTPYFDDKLKAAIAAARKTLPKKYKNALSPKNITKIKDTPPKITDKKLQKYFKNKGIIIPSGTTYDKTKNGFHWYAFPKGDDGKVTGGVRIPIYWDDPKPTPQTSPAPVQPNDKTSPLTLENIGDLTVNDLANFTPEDVEKFWAENEAKIKTLVDPSIIDEIVEIVNEVRKP